MINKTHEMVKNTRELCQYVLDQDIVKITDLIKNKPILIDLLNEYDETAMICNAVNNINANGAKIANILLDAGADINAGDDSTTSPLFFAVEYNNIHVAEVLLERGASLLTEHNTLSYCDSLLIRAIREQSYKMTILLLKYGADPTEMGFDNKIVFSEYIKRSSNKIIKYFSDYKIQKELIDKYPEIYFDFKENKFLNRQIKKEYKHLETANELNLLS